VLKLLTIVSVGLLAASPVAGAESKLLETVKRNPAEARALCKKFQKMNSSGKSAYSKKSTKRLATSRNLSMIDAEVFVTYVVGMYCPDVR
jgi:hypothetical protein